MKEHAANRWNIENLKRAFVVLGCLEAAPSKKTVKTEEFILVDADGAQGGMLEVGPGGGGRLILWSCNGDVLFESPRRSLNDFANP